MRRRKQVEEYISTKMLEIHGGNFYYTYTMSLNFFSHGFSFSSHITQLFFFPLSHIHNTFKHTLTSLNHTLKCYIKMKCIGTLSWFYLLPMQDQSYIVQHIRNKLATCNKLHMHLPPYILQGFAFCHIQQMVVHLCFSHILTFHGTCKPSLLHFYFIASLFFIKINKLIKLNF